MLLSAAFPACAFGELEEGCIKSSYLESSNHASCAVLMYESNKKISGHQNLSKIGMGGAKTRLFLSLRHKTDG